MGQDSIPVGAAANGDPAPAAVQGVLDGLKSPQVKAVSGEVESRTDAAVSVDSRPQQPRLLFGGGPPNATALQDFWRYAGGNEAHVVVIGWGSTVSEEYYTKLRDAFTSAIQELADASGHARDVFKINIEKMPEVEQLGGDIEPALELLRKATGIFFLGGDQVRLMNALKTTGIGEVVRHLVESNAVVHAGTSAGTAVGSRVMIGGDGEPPANAVGQRFVRLVHARVAEDGQQEQKEFFVGEGLGIVPDNVVIEQHLLRRGRVQRLTHALQSIPHVRWGIGIEDSMAVMWSGVGRIKAVGPTRVLILGKQEDGSVQEVASLRNGEIFDLELGRRMASGE